MLRRSVICSLAIVTFACAQPRAPQDGSDPLLAADPGAEHLTAREGRMVWSSRAGGSHRLVALTTDGVELLPVPGSRRSLFPHLGRRADGAPVVAYVRCSVRACRPWLWDFARGAEAPVPVRVRRGCRLAEVAVWRELIVLVYSDHDLPEPRGRTCSGAVRGLWIKRGTEPARRMSRSAYRLGDVRGRLVSWFEDFSGGDVWRLRLASIPTAASTVDVGSIDGGSLRGGSISGGRLYFALHAGDGWWWLQRHDANAGNLTCWPPGGREQEPFQTFSFPNAGDGPDFAVDGGRVLYVDWGGIFEFRREPWTC